MNGAWWLGAGLALALAALAVAACDSTSTTSLIPSSSTSGASSGVAEPAPETPAEVAVALRDIDFDTIKFDIEKDAEFKPEMITPEIKKLDGKRVVLRGYMLPSFQQSGITRFVLVRDNLECCFGPGAALYDCVIVDMVEGESAEFSVRPVAVTGKFTLDTYKDSDDVVRAVYHLQGESVK